MDAISIRTLSHSEYIAFLDSMSKEERIKWRRRFDQENQRIFNMAPRGRPKKIAENAEQLSLALNFIAAATDNKKDADLYKQHVRFRNNMAIAFNGQVSAGHPIAEDLNLCPHLDKLQKAILKCGKSLAIAQTPSGALSIKGDSLRALIPCLPYADLPEAAPDAPQPFPLDDRIKEAFKACGSLASEAGARVIEASLLLEANTCTGTNGAAIMQVWHGLNLPPHIVLPKLFTEAVAKQPKPITGFGFSHRLNEAGEFQVLSFTVWFDGGCWIKTACYADRWPPLDSIMNAEAHPSDIPAGLFEAIDAVDDFHEKGYVVLMDGKVQSHYSEEVGAQFDVKGLQGGKQFQGKLMKQIAPYCKSIDLTTFKDRAFFFGQTPDVSKETPGLQLRGVVMAIRSGEGPSTSPTNQAEREIQNAHTHDEADTSVNHPEN